VNENPSSRGERAVWCRRAYAVENDGAWTALPMHDVVPTMRGSGPTPAAAFNGLAARLRLLADEIDDGGEL
jgi:hypothetical protein